MLKDPGVDAIYIATPHPGHAEWAIKAAEAGKHVLVEKPLALTAFEVDAIHNAHRKAGTFVGEAFMYRLHPLTKKLGELISSGAIGEVRMIQSSFGFQMPKFMPEHRLFANDMAGGGILDVGGYPVSMSRFIAGAAAGKPFLDPIKVGGHRAPRQGRHRRMVGGRARIRQRHHRRRSAARCSLNLENVLRIIGTTGRIEVQDFWFAGGDAAAARARSRSSAARTSRPSRPATSLPASLLVRSRRRGRGNLRRQAGIRLARHELGRQPRQRSGARRMAAGAGLEYNIEKSSKRTTTLKGHAARSAGGTRIAKRTIPGLTKQASIVATGFEDFRSFASAAILLDGFFEAGGNLFDTGFVYGAGYTEKLLGEWHTNRGMREEIADHRQGRPFAALLSRRDRQAARRDARPAEDRLCRHLFHAPRQSRRAGRRVRRRHGCRGEGRPHPRTVRRLELDQARMEEAIDYAKKTGKRARARSATISRSPR